MVFPFHSIVLNFIIPQLPKKILSPRRHRGHRESIFYPIGKYRLDKKLWPSSGIEHPSATINSFASKRLKVLFCPEKSPGQNKK
jgi:hypothetical protein